MGGEEGGASRGDAEASPTDCAAPARIQMYQIDSSSRSCRAVFHLSARQPRSFSPRQRHGQRGALMTARQDRGEDMRTREIVVPYYNHS